MEEDDDDLYGPPEPTVNKTEENKPDVHQDDGERGDEPMDEGLESGEEEEDEEESDSEIEIILDKPQPPKPAVQPAEASSKAVKIEQPHHQQTTTNQSTTPAAPTAPQQLGNGNAYPAVRTSNIDVNQDPVYPPVGKPISQIDMDADLAESTKPWRLPGSDQSDYFNYGFDEFSWEMYRQKQASMRQTLEAQKSETAHFQQMFGGGMPPLPGVVAPAGPAAAAASNVAGPVPGAPTGPAAQQVVPQDMGMPGMPPGGLTPEMMGYMTQQMQNQGMNPENMDFGSFMAAFTSAQQSGPGFGGAFGPGGGGGQYGAGGGGGRGGRRGGRW